MATPHAAACSTLKLGKPGRFISGTLADEWPRRIGFDTNLLIENTEVRPLGLSDLDETFYGLIDWLATEGFIRFDRKEQGESWVEDVQITAKAMDAIGHALPTERWRQQNTSRISLPALVQKSARPRSPTR